MWNILLLKNNRYGTYFCPNFKNLLEIIWHGGKLGLWKKEKIVVKYVKFVNMKESTIKEILLH